jgi:hypothetical protein
MAKKRSSILILAIVFALLVSHSVLATPTVTYSVSGSPNDWLLDFSVANTLGVDNMDIYFFGVLLPARDIVSSPSGWDASYLYSWDNVLQGGSSNTYNNNWIDLLPLGDSTLIPDLIQNGESLGGFTVRVTSNSAPTSVNWYAYAYDFTFGGALYAGADYFNAPSNPGFEGIANSGTIPEPTSLLLLGTGLAGIGLAAWRRKKA